MPLLEVLQNQVCMTTEWHRALIKNGQINATSKLSCQQQSLFKTGTLEIQQCVLAKLRGF